MKSSDNIHRQKYYSSIRATYINHTKTNRLLEKK